MTDAIKPDQEVSGLPTAEQFRETAKRFRTVVEYGLSGMTLGDNEAARAALACEIAADLVENGNRRFNVPGRGLVSREEYEEWRRTEFGDLRAEIERLRAALVVIHKLSAPTTHSWQSAQDAFRNINQIARRSLEQKE